MKLYQKAPDGVPLSKFPKYCSIDGDADRLIYFFVDKHNQFRILDGDRFSVLFASFLALKLKEAKLLNDVTIGVIQTAYANGRSTDYLVNVMVLPPERSRIFPIGVSLESSSGVCANRREAFASQGVGLRHWHLLRSQRSRNGEASIDSIQPMMSSVCPGPVQ